MVLCRSAEGKNTRGTGKNRELRQFLSKMRRPAPFLVLKWPNFAPVSRDFLGSPNPQPSGAGRHSTFFVSNFAFSEAISFHEQLPVLEAVSRNDVFFAAFFAAFSRTMTDAAGLAVLDVHVDGDAF